MTEMECIERIKDLRDLKRIYNNILTDEFSTFYKNSSIQALAIKTDTELARLEELLHNLELEDSYDPNTGWRSGEKMH